MALSGVGEQSRPALLTTAAADHGGIRRSLVAILIIVFAGLAFGALWWGLSRLGAPPFVVAAVSFAVGALVLVSNGMLGIKL